MKRSISSILTMALLICGSAAAADYESRDALGPIFFDHPAISEDRTPPAEKEMSPGITKEFRFVSDNAAAVLISTKIRADLPKDDRVLDRVEPKQQVMERSFGPDRVSSRRISTPQGTVLELTVFNHIYDPVFPYGTSPGDAAKELTTVAISQTFVSAGRLIELAIHLTRDENESREEFLSRAREVSANWRTSVEVK